VQLGRIYRVLPGESAKFRGLKCALSVAGICDDFISEPFTRFEDADREKIRALLSEMGILPAG
jgi:4-hydroxy-tetrahydrodipicolinate synthase